MIIDEFVSVTSFNPKYVLQQLNGLVRLPKAKLDKGSRGTSTKRP